MSAPHRARGSAERPRRIARPSRLFAAGGLLLVLGAGSPAWPGIAVAAAGPAPGAVAGTGRGTVVTRSHPQESAAGALSRAELDQRTAEVAAQLRCPVCRNQSVLESSSTLAREMQGVIRDRLAAGEDPEAIKDYFVGRYGEWILLKPEARGINLIVYLLPLIALILGALILFRLLRRWARTTGAETDSARAVEPAAGLGIEPAAGAAHDANRTGSDRAAGAAATAAGDTGISDDDERWLRDELDRAG